MDRLKLIALDREDIEVVSAHLQDAVVKAADIRWRPAEKRLVVALNRFDWESANSASPEFRRRRAALRFERVTACKCRNCTPVEKGQILNLLAVSFEETDQPAGVMFGHQHFQPVLQAIKGGGHEFVEVTPFYGIPGDPIPTTVEFIAFGTIDETCVVYNKPTGGTVC